MSSFIQASTFQYNPNSSPEIDAEFSGILEIHVHHASNIHNICIYDKQDVYAKFSLTYNPDDTIPTRIVAGGGRNPVFDEDLFIKVCQRDAVLKCEIWMLSRVKCYMEDQLLGFALVPLSSVIGKGKITQEFNLSSTDLFHSPAGTVKLTLFFSTDVPFNLSANPSSDSVTDSSVMSELVLLDRKASEVCLDLVEYSRIESPDVNEHQRIVSEYFADLSRTDLIGECSFLQLGATHQPTENSTDDGCCYVSLVSRSDDERSSVNSMDKNDQVAADFLNSPNVSISMESNQCPETQTSEKERESQEPDYSGTGNEGRTNNGTDVKLGQVFSAPPGNINFDAEQSVMQQQIVDIYMKSMQQFTESLAKMKLPMDMDIALGNHQSDLIHNQNNTAELDNKKNSNSRVFYGSRAFF